MLIIEDDHPPLVRQAARIAIGCRRPRRWAVGGGGRLAGFEDRTGGKNESGTEANQTGKATGMAREMERLPGIFISVKTVNELNDIAFGEFVIGGRSSIMPLLAALIGALAAVARPREVHRYSPERKLDSDGAFAAMKFVRDAVAKAYGVDDGAMRLNGPGLFVRSVRPLTGAWVEIETVRKQLRHERWD